MLFKSNKPNVTVWDKKTNKPLAKFKDGSFETNDKAVVKKLEAAKYLGYGEIEEEQKKDEDKSKEG